MPPDVLVIGGGPAGATAAAILAGQGKKVLLVESSHFPRHHVGESLQPASMRILDRHLGLGPKLAAQGFARKYGALYRWGDSRAPWSVLFDARLDADLSGLDEQALLNGGYEHAWQVERATFDHLLLQAAREAGVEVLEGCEAIALSQNDDTIQEVTLKNSEKTWTVQPQIVIDASGQRALLGRHFDLHRPVTDLRATATYAYFDGAGGVPGPLGRHVQLVVTIPEGWAWFIPISATRTSVGVICHSRERLSLQRFEELLAEANLPLETATRVEGPQDGLRFVRDWSFYHSRFHGKNWFLVGDAACFVDPVLSGGVDFAIRGAANAALAILQGGPEAAERYNATLQKEYRAYLGLARYWYGNNRSVDGFFWEAHRAIAEDSVSTPFRAFIYLTTGHHAADRHFKVFAEWQEERMFKALGVDAKRVQAATQKQLSKP